MSVSREWNSLKAAWVILLIALVARVFLSSQFLLTPDEAVYWQAAQYPSPDAPLHLPLLAGAIRLSTALFGNSELAVRLPANLAVTLVVIYMALLAASMFSWHTALHATLLGHGILLFNMAALVVSPYSLLLPCWTAVCYHSSQAMNDNRMEQWLFAGFWFGLGLLCKFSIVLLLPCLILCLILIKPYRICLLYPGPWLGFLLSLAIFVSVTFWLGNTSLAIFIKKIHIFDLAHDLIPDVGYSLQFFIDQTILVTPVVLLLILAGWLSGANKRYLAKPDVQFLTLTSFPLFLLYFIFPVFADNDSAWSATAYITAIVLLAGLHSSTRSSFKGGPNHRWILSIITAYCFTIPLILQIAYPALPLPWHPNQTELMNSGWDQLGKTLYKSVEMMPAPDKTFIFTMDPRIASELAFYIPGNPRTVTLDYRTRTNRKDFLTNEMQLSGKNGLGLVSTRAALEQTKLLFDRIELEKKLTQHTDFPKPTGKDRTFYVIRGFNFKIR